MVEQRQKQKQPSEAEAIAIIAGALAVGAAPQATATMLSPLIGVPVPDLLPILIIALSRPVKYDVPTIPTATASAAASRLEPAFRAHYVYAATKRLQGLTGGERQKALAREQQYFNQHLAAVTNRRSAAASVDRARARYGEELGWYAKMDSRTSPECRAANGKNFFAGQIPPIGFPGAVHPHCRCKPGRAHRTSQTVYAIQPRKEAA